MGSEKMVTQNHRISIWMGESIQKIEGTKWTKNSSGVTPLSFSVKPFSDFTIHLQDKAIHLSGKEAYLTASGNHLIQTFAINVLLPLPFDEAKQKTLELTESLGLFSSRFKQEIKKWVPGTLPEDNESKVKLKVTRRSAYAVEKVDQKFKFQVLLTEESPSLWQAGIIISLISK